MTYLLCLKTLSIPIFYGNFLIFFISILMDYSNITIILLVVSYNYNYNINILNSSGLAFSYLSLSSI